MKPAVINVWVDILCLITFIPMLITGLVLYIYLPSGSGRSLAGSAWA
ncbi:MAG TPA: hypothetical protein PKM50_07045 [Methanoregula sp.]|nr:hypothetical protein [Methanoregula sp.]